MSGTTDRQRLINAIGYAPITASMPGGGGGLTYMAAVDRDRIVDAILAAGFGDVTEAKADAWDEGWKALEMWTGEDADAVNPYRKNESNE